MKLITEKERTKSQRNKEKVNNIIPMFALF